MNETTLKPMGALYRILGAILSLLLLFVFFHKIIVSDVMSSGLRIFDWLELILLIIVPAYILPVCILGRPPHALRKIYGEDESQQRRRELKNNPVILAAAAITIIWLFVMMVQKLSG